MEPRAEPATAREGAKGRRAAAEGVVAARVALGERRGGGVLTLCLNQSISPVILLGLASIQFDRG